MTPRLLQLFDVVLQELAAGHVGQAHAACDEGRNQKCPGALHEVFGVDPNEPTEKVEGPQPRQHCQLPCIDPDLCTLDVGQLAAAAGSPQVDHADAPHGRSDVGHGASDLVRERV